MLFFHSVFAWLIFAWFMTIVFGKSPLAGGSILYLLWYVLTVRMLSHLRAWFLPDFFRSFSERSSWQVPSTVGVSLVRVIYTFRVRCFSSSNGK